MARGAKPGERRGGRGQGSKNKATAEAKLAIEDLAKLHAPDALKALTQVALNGQSEAARVSAAVAIMDRAYGRPGQSVALSGADGGPVKTIQRIELVAIESSHKDEA